MIYELTGRIDTSNAASFEKELMEAADKDTLILDAAQLEYISSAGLRVILKLKKRQDDLTIKNVSSEVYEIFDMTGFTDMLNIERALRTIDLASCTKIGNGGTGTVYRYDDETIVKAYHEGVRLEEIENERKYARAAFIAGIPTAIPFDMVKIGNCYGNVYELMNSNTLSNAFITQPEKYDELITKYADLYKTLATAKINPSDFDSYKSLMLKRCSRLADIYGKEYADAITSVIEHMKSEGCLIHGDLHPANIMLQDGELMLIDMADVTIGPSFYELVAIYRDIGVRRSEQAAELMYESVGLKPDMAYKIWDDFFAKLMEGKDEETIRQTQTKIDLINALFSTVMLSVSPSNVIELIAPLMIEQVIKPVIMPNLDTLKAMLDNTF